jgi:hypothetical protein
MRPIRLLAVAVLSLAPSVALADDEAEAKKVAETYLNALTGKGDEAGKELLLGGATMNAQLFTLENWTIVKKDWSKSEESDLGHAVGMMNDLDKTGRAVLTKLMGAEAVGDDISTHELSAEEAAKLMKPTKEKAEKFVKAHPVLAYVARVGKEVYWHPKNPLRPLLGKSGNSGKYTLTVYRWIIESKEGPRAVPREWPLRVLRFKTSKIDTGWKVLPASDWNAE